MKYFNKFPLLAYPIDDAERVVSNITIAIRINRKLTDNDVIYYPYSVKDYESPEKVSERFYESNEYHWVLLLVNNIGNVYEQWAMPTDMLMDEALLKYDDLYGVHHWENSKGHVVSPPQSGDVSYDAEPISNWDYEIRVNDAKRQIKIVAPQYISEFKRQFEELMLK